MKPKYRNKSQVIRMKHFHGSLFLKYALFFGKIKQKIERSILVSVVKNQ